MLRLRRIVDNLCRLTGVRPIRYQICYEVHMADHLGVALPGYLGTSLLYPDPQWVREVWYGR